MFEQGRFEQKVKQHVEQLKRFSCREIENKVAQKRTSWIRQNRHKIANHKQISPRQAFKLLFFDYMGLAVNELPIISETATKIVWKSTNQCPTLEAAKQLNMDTRHICREVYEKSTQAFLSQLDPQLRFLRSYEEIRPYANYCKEMIVRVNFESMMRLAIKEARLSKQDGNKGHGAIIILGNEIIAKSHDTTITEQDPSQHAEVNAIRQAVHSQEDSNLSGAILFSTCEPCPMCSSLAIEANLTTIVYGTTPDLEESRIHINAKEIVKKSPIMLELIGNVLKDECQSLYT